MKNEWSKSWKASKRPGKQRKYTANAPLHIKSKLLNVHLSKELRDKYKFRNVRVKKGDKIKILVGDHKGQTGKVNRVRMINQKVYVEGIENIKKDGNKVFIPFKPSNLIIVELDLTDKIRKAKLERKIKEKK